MKKTKIVCTIGPSTDDDNVLREMMKNGMDVARFNFSHSEHDVHKKRFEQVCRLRDELGLNIATLLDTKGPEVRLKTFEKGSVVINEGDTFTLTTRDVQGDETICSITFENLPKDISIGTAILIDDGAIELCAQSVNSTDIACKVIRGGKISDHKGINVPDVNLTMPYISDADMKDLEFGAKMGFDYIAASFVRTGADVIYLRKFTQSLGWFNPRIIAKIENAQGVENIDEILEAADGIMVARGDMGVEIPFEKIPAIQKELIKKAYNAGKNVITATQMLESMISNARPTRAEITDVANAIYDGSSAIMLSGETAAGSYPVEAVRTMAKICETTEQNINYTKRFHNADIEIRNDIDAISHSTCGMAIDVGAKCIVACTLSGITARMVSRFRSPVDIIGLTTNEATWRKLALSWGVTPEMCETFPSTEVLFYSAKKVAQTTFSLEKGDKIVITGGVSGVSGNTNLIKIDEI